MEAKPRKSIYYRDSKGKEPAKEWLHSLRDIAGKARIFTRIERAERGNFGDHKTLGNGVSELRIDFGPGYRVYFAIDADDTIILLLVAGDKPSQQDDIEKAKVFWKEHRDGKGK